MLPNPKEVWGLLGSPCPQLTPLGPAILLLCNLGTLVPLESTSGIRSLASECAVCEGRNHSPTLLQKHLLGACDLCVVCRAHIVQTTLLLMFGLILSFPPDCSELRPSSCDGKFPNWETRNTVSCLLITERGTRHRLCQSNPWAGSPEKAVPQQVLHGRHHG